MKLFLAYVTQVLIWAFVLIGVAMIFGALVAIGGKAMFETLEWLQ